MCVEICMWIWIHRNSRWRSNRHDNSICADQNGYTRYRNNSCGFNAVTLNPDISKLVLHLLTRIVHERRLSIVSLRDLVTISSHLYCISNELNIISHFQFVSVPPYKLITFSLNEILLSRSLISSIHSTKKAGYHNIKNCIIISKEFLITATDAAKRRIVFQFRHISPVSCSLHNKTSAAWNKLFCAHFSTPAQGKKGLKVRTIINFLWMLSFFTFVPSESRDALKIWLRKYWLWGRNWSSQRLYGYLDINGIRCHTAYIQFNWKNKGSGNRVVYFPILIFARSYCSNDLIIFR